MPSPVLQEYSRHRPVQITNPRSPFYFRLCRNIKDDVWNSNQAMGQNTLSKFVKTMCRKAGKDRRKTNHSARKTTVTLLVNAVVPPIYPSFANTICGHKNVPFYKQLQLCFKRTVKQMSKILSMSLLETTILQQITKIHLDKKTHHVY